MSETPGQTDSVIPFQIDGRAIRGRIVELDESLNQILSAHDYPPAVARILGEAVLIGAMVSRALKFEGRLLVQAQGDGPISMLVADCKTNGDMRGYARFDGDKLSSLLAYSPHPSAKDLLGGGTFAMTIDQGPDMDRYQGLAAIDGQSLADSAEHYFRQSEQIPSRIRLAVGEVFEPGGKHRWHGSGMLLQRIAGDTSRGATDDDWDTATALFETVSDEELVDPGLSAQSLLFRLFHEEGVRVEDPDPVRAKCSCSRERLGSLLASFDREAIQDMLEDGKISANCEFCNTTYEFRPADLG